MKPAFSESAGFRALFIRPFPLGNVKFTHRMRTPTSFPNAAFLIQNWDEKLLRNLLSEFRFYMTSKWANLDKALHH